MVFGIVSPKIVAVNVLTDGVFVPELVGDLRNPIYGGKSTQFASFYRHMWQPYKNQPEMGQLH